MTRATVSTRPISPNQIEVRTRCQHGGYRIGYQLGQVLTERAAVCAALFHHHTLVGCACMKTLWPRYRTATASADIDGLRDRFNAVWSGIEGQQRQRGFAVIDWPAALQALRGEVA